MDMIGAFLDSQFFIALFLVIGLGYAAGRIRIAGFSLGIGAVLFVGLAVGAIAPKAAPPGLIGLIGLVLFFYGIGIQYGKEFFQGLVSPLGIKANVLAFVAVVANVLLRNFGLTLFLAAVGMSSGSAFAQNLGASGLSYILSGVFVLLSVVLIVVLVGYFLLRMRFDDVLGIASGATGNPAILAYANQLAPTGRPDIGYAMIFPGVGTIVKVIAVQVMVSMTSAGAPPPG